MSPNASNPYKVLGVSELATADEIRRAYRRLARRLHPDTGGTDTAAMTRVNDAWRLLSDPRRRAAFDEDTWDPTPETEPGDGARPLPGMRVLIIAALVLLVFVFVAIVLVGFGRVGVVAHP